MAFLLAGLAFAGCATAADDARAPTVVMRPLPLSEALARDRRIGATELLGAWQLSSSAAGFGGFSALLVEGDTLLALSDRAVLWRARMAHGGDGRLTGLEAWRSVPVGDPARDDTEALARLTGGTLVMALEAPFALRALEGALPPDATALAAALDRLQPNRGVEALASLPGGGLLALVEGRESDGTHRMVALGRAGLSRGRYRSASGFAPTAAERLGRHLLVLERRFSLTGGFENRIVVLDAATAAGQHTPLVGREIARLGMATISENFEGIAATRAADGTVLLLVISDDNFSPLQRTVLLQLGWREESR